MSLANYSGFAVALSGSNLVIAPLASVAVRLESSGALATIYSDRAGAVPITNPMTADAFGRFSFYAAGTVYRITVTEAGSPGTELTLRYQAVGTFAELDNPFTAAGDLLVGSGASGTPVRKAVGSDGYGLVPSSSATDKLAWIPPGLGFNLVGGYLDWSVVGSPTSTLSVEIKTWSGNTPSDTEPVFIPFRSATAGTGTITYRKITTATSITIDSGALLGTVSGVPFRLWCVAFDDGGTIRLAIINCVATSANAGSGRNVDSIYPLGAWGIASATQEGTGSDSAGVFYSNGAAVSAKAYAALGYASWEGSGLPNAGNWNSDPTREQLFGAGVPLPGQRIQVQRSQPGAVISGTTAIPLDDTIPQNTEGTQAYSLSISTSSAANVLEICATVYATQNTGGGQHIIGALFVDAVANAVAAGSSYMTTDGTAANMPVVATLLASAIAAVKLRFGNVTGSTTHFNGISGGTRAFGGVAAGSLTVSEIMG